MKAPIQDMDLDTAPSYKARDDSVRVYLMRDAVVHSDYCVVDFAQHAELQRLTPFPLALRVEIYSRRGEPWVEVDYYFDVPLTVDPELATLAAEYKRMTGQIQEANYRRYREELPTEPDLQAMAEYLRVQAHYDAADMAFRHAAKAICETYTQNFKETKMKLITSLILALTATAALASDWQLIARTVFDTPNGRQAICVYRYDSPTMPQQRSITVDASQSCPPSP